MRICFWRPLTEAQRQRKIARLEALRDRALREAPFRFWMIRLMMLVFSAAIVTFLFLLLFSPPSDRRTFVAVAAGLGVMAAMCGYGIWRVWILPKPARGDLWAYADRAARSYDYADPRWLQARIDKLRAQSEPPANRKGGNG